MKSEYISVEHETLHGDNGVPTYFVDLVTVTFDGSSHSNLRSSKNITEARQIARDEATKRGCRVDDETLPLRPAHEPELRAK